MKGLELEGRNGTIGKIRDFKEMTKCKMKRRWGQSVILQNLVKKTLPWPTSHLAGRRSLLSTMRDWRKVVEGFQGRA